MTEVPALIRRALCGILLVSLSTVATAWGDTARLLILHTNDLHDHLRPGVGGIGGVAYQAGFINEVRASRNDVLLVDGGDMTEKGDLVAYLHRGEITFRILARMGYQALALGNHDHDFGMEQLRRFEALMGQPFLCLNLVNPDGSPQFEPSRVIEINGIKIGLIGLIAPRQAEFGGLDMQASGEALAAEAARLKAEVHLVVAVCHHATRACVEWSRAAPLVDVFVAAHNHEPLFEPVVVPETGALVVQAGSNGRWVGRLEVEVDLDARRIVRHHGSLVLMDHAQVEPDRKILAMVAALEAKLCPQVNDFVLEVDRPVGWVGLARLAAEVLRVRAEAEIGFCHPRQILRNALAAGPANINDIFRTAAERVEPALRLELTGAEIGAYLQALADSEPGLTQWAGFRLERGKDGHGLRTDLKPDRHYRVVMPWREWDRYFVRALQRAPAGSWPGRDREKDYPTASVEFTYLEAMVDYLRELAATGETLSAKLSSLRARQGDGDPQEAQTEAYTLRAVDFAAIRAAAATSRK